MRENDISAGIEKLNTSSDSAAEVVIQRLVSYGKVVVPALIEAARNRREPKVRKWSLQALGAIGDRRAAPVLIEALGDERMTVRLHAVKGLGRMKYKKAAKDIASLLGDSSGGVRVNAIQVLMELGDPSVGVEVQKSLDDPKWYVRQAACVACGKLGIAGAFKMLGQLCKNDERKAVRMAAEEALEQLR